jgi:small subunit ribosomal protein S8
VDPIADMLTAIRNAYLVKKPEVLVPYSKFKLEVAKALEKEKFVGTVKKLDARLAGPLRHETSPRAKIIINLLYENQKPKLHEIKKVSKLGLRVYTKSKNIKKVKGGRGIILISTPQGVMTGEQAKAKKMGGEVICRAW